jgi:hypothetical protein
MRKGIMIPRTTKLRMKLCASVTGMSETKLEKVV